MTEANIPLHEGDERVIYDSRFAYVLNNADTVVRVYRIGNAGTMALLHG